MTQRMQWPSISTVNSLAQPVGIKKLNVVSIGSLLIATLLIAQGCATHQEIHESVPDAAPSKSMSGAFSDPSLTTLSQGLSYVREHPSTREDERIQRFLWLDQWLKVLQDKNRLSPEMAQEFWSDLVSFVKEPTPVAAKGLERVVQGSQTRLGKNIANYYLYLALLKEQSLEAALKNLEYVEDDGVSDLYPKAQGLLQLFRNKQSSDSKKIGVLLPLSGPLRPLAEEVLQAIQVAGNLAYGSGTEFVIEDTGASEADLLKAWDKLAVQEKVAAVIGPLTSKETEIIFERAEVTSVPVISLAPKEGLEGFGNFSFRSVLTLEDQVRRISRHLSDDLKVKRVAVLLPDSPYGWEVMTAAEKEFKARGLTITQMAVYKNGATDFKDQLRRITRLDVPRLRKDELCPKDKGTKEPKEKEAKPGSEEANAAEAALANEPIQLDACVKKLNQLKPLVDFEALFAPDSAETAGFLLPTLPYLRIYGVEVVGLSQYNSPKLIERAGEHAEGVVFTDGYLPNSNETQNRFFRERYTKVTQKEPSRLAAEAFDLAMIIVKTIRDTGALSREMMVDRLKTIRDFPGVTGSIYYENHKFKKEPKLLIVRNGAIQELRAKN
jgi:branched-chain amino acid transport system substrate-binding protein